MAAPNAHEWRFIVRSKDRISGTPNNFVAQLPNQIPENCEEVYIRLASIACGTYPSPTDVLTLTTSSYTNGGYAIQPNIPAVSATANPYSFSTASAVDVCMNFSTLSTLDTDTANNALKSYVTSAAIPANASAVTTLTIPLANRSGIALSGPTQGTSGDSVTIGSITGIAFNVSQGAIIISFASQTTPLFPAGTPVYVTPVQPPKMQSDRTLALVPFSRGDGERLLRLYSDAPWVKISPSNFGQFSVKLFDDLGFPLKLKKLYYGGSPDYFDCNISDWVMELHVLARPHLPADDGRRKI